MKKLLVFALVLAMVLAVSATVLADSFVSSPSNDDKPTLVDFSVTAEDWDGEILVASFKESADKEDMKAAYESIKAAASVSDLVSSLTEKGLAVSTLFDVYATKEGMGTATIKLTSDKFKNFVALLHYVDGEWEIVEDAKVEDTTLTFTSESFSPYAVVVSTDAVEPDTSDETSTPETSTPDTSKPESPETGDVFPVAIVAFAVLFGAAGVCFLAKSKENA